MSESTAARVYAEALFEVATEIGKVVAIGKELEQFRKALAKRPTLGIALSTPRIRAADKRHVLEQLFDGITPETLNFLKLLVDKGRFLSFAAICDRFADLADRAANRVKVRTLSARALLKKDINRIRKAVRAKTGGAVVVTAAVEAGLLGGLIIRVGDRILDGSLRSRLALVHRRLREVRTASAIWEGVPEDVGQAIRQQFAPPGEDEAS